MLAIRERYAGSRLTCAGVQWLHACPELTSNLKA